MLRKFKDLSPKMVRMYGSSMESSDFQIPGRDYMSKTSCRDSKPDPDLESVTLHHLIRADGKPYSAELRNYDNMFKNSPSFSDHGEIMNYKKILSKACQEELKHYDVIFCTTAVATNWRFLKATQGKIFQMIIDEAGMCTEPETLAPIISSKAEQVVLIGDHKQLQPVVLCSEAASLGLEKSLFERYADQAVFLDCQYRMVSVMRKFELNFNISFRKQGYMIAYMYIYIYYIFLFVSESKNMRFSLKAVLQRKVRDNAFCRLESY